MKTMSIGNLHVPLPVIQGGMGVGVSLSGLASAVAEEGGIGVISAVGIGMTEPDYRKNFKEANKTALKKEIRKARAKTKGVLGVNIMYAVTDYDDLLKVALEEGIDVVITGAGLLLKLPANIDSSVLKSRATKFIPKVSSGRAARIIFHSWSERYNRVPDAVVVEGPMAGGHLGFTRQELDKPQKDLASLVKETLQELLPYEQKYGLEIPVIAGGGIYDGGDMYEIMEAGASAVKIGTRFVTTVECDVADAFKQNYINSTPDDIVIINSPVGLPGRVIVNDFVQAIQAGERKPVKCSWKCLKTCDYRKVPYCIAEALFSAARGNFDEGFSFAGSKAWMATEILTVHETINRLRSEYSLAELSRDAVLAV